MYIAAAADPAQKPEDALIQSEKFDQERHYDRGKPQNVCAHCGSKRHDDRGCWKQLTSEVRT